MRGSAGAHKFSCCAFVVVSSQNVIKEVSDLKSKSVWHTALAAPLASNAVMCLPCRCN